MLQEDGVVFQILKESDFEPRFLYPANLSKYKIWKQDENISDVWRFGNCIYQCSLIKSYWSFYLGLPWWRSGWKSTCQCRGHGFEAWSGKIPHATEQLSLCATTTEPARHNYWAHVPRLLKPVCPRAHAPQQEKPPQWEACAPQQRVAPARWN